MRSTEMMYPFLVCRDRTGTRPRCPEKIMLLVQQGSVVRIVSPVRGGDIVSFWDVCVVVRSICDVRTIVVAVGCSGCESWVCTEVVSFELSDDGAGFGALGGAIFTFDTYCATLPWVDLAFANTNAFRVAGVLRVLVVLVV